MDKDLIAAFLAKGGAITKVPEGARTMSPREMKLAVGYEPDKVVVFEALLVGEDYSTFMVEERGARVADVRAKLGRAYPESRIVSIEPKGTRDARLYREAYDSDY